MINEHYKSIFTDVDGFKNRIVSKQGAARNKDVLIRTTSLHNICIGKKITWLNKKYSDS